MSRVLAAMRRPLPGAVALALCAGALPLLTGNGYHTFLVTTIGIYVLVAMGLNLLFGYAGQVSIGHGALMAVGAYTTAILTVDHGWAFWPAALVAAVLATVAGSLMALPALRLSSWHIALITLAFALILRGLLIDMRDLTGGWGGIVGIPRPQIGGVELDDQQLLWVVLAFDVVAFLLIRNVVGSRIGGGLRAVRDAPEAGLTVGARVVRLKLFAFASSALLAGVAGSLLVAQEGLVTPDTFHLELSIFFLLAVILGGAGRLLGPIVGTVAFFAVPDLLDVLGSWRVLVYGVALLVLMIYAPDGIVGAVDRLRALVGRRLRRGGASDAAEPPPPRPVAPASHGATRGRTAGATLELRDVAKAFGGVRALDGASLSVAAGTVHAIVGPNGSGKTTMLNVATRLVLEDAGEVRVAGVSLERAGPERLPRLGVARTFQTPKLLASASATDNVVLGAYAAERARGPELVLDLPRARRERRELEAQARELLAFVGLGALLDATVATLPHGQQRLLETARALMARPRLILMDEPAAGLSLGELDALAALIGDIRAAGTTVVLVEHDTGLVADVADAVTVLDQGRTLVSGTVEEALSDQRVVHAYLGGAA